MTAFADRVPPLHELRLLEGSCCDTTRRAAFARRIGTVISMMSTISTAEEVPRENVRRSRRASAARSKVVDWARAHGSGLLFIDDNHFLLEATARAFRRVGASCRTAGSHEDGVRALERDERLRAVILDYEMPDGDVRQLVHRLRAIRADILLVGTSGGDREQDFADRGVDRFVPKPWSLDELVHAVSG